jgi:hypothetical protein
MDATRKVIRSMLSEDDEISPEEFYPDYFNHQEYDPAWDYEMVRPDENTKKFVNGIMASLEPDFKRLGFDRVFVLYAAETKGVGTYINGTSQAPVILLDVGEIQQTAGEMTSEWGSDSDEELFHGIKGTVIHEIGHAYLEAAGLYATEYDHDEDVVEEFARELGWREDFDSAVAILDDYIDAELS